MNIRLLQQLHYALLLLISLPFSLFAESGTTLLRLDLRGVVWVAASRDPALALEVLPDAGARRFDLALTGDSASFWEYGARADGSRWRKGTDYTVRTLPGGLELLDRRGLVFVRICGSLEPGGSVVLEFEPPARAVLVASVAEATEVPIGPETPGPDPVGPPGP